MIASEIPADAVVTGDLPCHKCEYNLRTIAAHGRCPECGTPVIASLGSFGEAGARAVETVSRGVLYSVFVGSPLLMIALGWPVLVGGAVLVLWAYRNFSRRTKPTLPADLRGVFDSVAGLSWIILAVLLGLAGVTVMSGMQFLRPNQTLPAMLALGVLAVLLPFAQALLYAATCRRLLRAAPPAEAPPARTREDVLKLICGGVIGVGGAILLGSVLTYFIFSFYRSWNPPSAVLTSGIAALVLGPGAVWVVATVERAAAALRSATQWQRYITGKKDPAAPIDEPPVAGTG